MEFNCVENKERVEWDLNYFRKERPDWSKETKVDSVTDKTYLKKYQTLLYIVWFFSSVLNELYWTL